ncbi:MAG: aldehyde dehydrogenase family protein [Oligoflexia bacterium]|nr:aldehyde dehydrogenase family protein [Oligoflexia bacterium]
MATGFLHEVKFRLFFFSHWIFKKYLVGDKICIKLSMMEKISFLGSYVKGRFQSPSKKNFIKKHISPADFKDLIFTWPEKNTGEIDSAILAGKTAHKNWARLSLKERVKRLSPLKTIIKQNINPWAELISRETGKPLWESQGEVKALLSKTDFVLKEGLTRIQDQTVPQAKGRIRFKSRGLLLVIGPFNFPMLLPLGQILPALAVGNTVIFKPSEKTPASGQKLTQAFDRLDLGSGVFQMIQGGAEVSKKLCQHKEIDGALFTGSFEVGQKIKESIVKDFSKILVLEMGGYNSALIWEDADLDLAVKETLKGCFWTSGQRCSSTSQIVLHKKIAKDFTKKFIKSAQEIKGDHWSKNSLMGSLIDSKSIQRFFDLQKEIKDRGGKALLEGKQILKEKGYYVSPGLYKMKFDKNSSFGTKESFTPQVIFYETDSLDQALEMINHSGYGLSLSVFSKNKKIQEEIFHRAKVGLINHNLSTAGASSYLPFGGLGKSGNDRPAGAFAIDFCVTPLAEKTKGDF